MNIENEAWCYSTRFQIEPLIAYSKDVNAFHSLLMTARKKKKSRAMPSSNRKKKQRRRILSECKK